MRSWIELFRCQTSDEKERILPVRGRHGKVADTDAGLHDIETDDSFSWVLQLLVSTHSRVERALELGPEPHSPAQRDRRTSWGACGSPHAAPAAGMPAGWLL